MAQRAARRKPRGIVSGAYIAVSNDYEYRAIFFDADNNLRNLYSI
jgi:hypothetical protein